MIVKINKIPDDIFLNLKKIIKDKSKEDNQELAGNLEEEFSLNDYIPILEPYLMGVMSKSPQLVDYYQNGGYKLSTSHRPLKLAKLWVNFQKKHEFNPIHDHYGVFSFIIFIQIPYTSEEQRKISPGKKSNDDMAGKLEFLCYDTTGRLHLTKINADKSWEQSMLIFPAKLAHTVYPFYGTDEYRITISGNVSIEV